MLIYFAYAFKLALIIEGDQGFFTTTIKTTRAS